jgi:hypothetical protein
MLWKCPACEIQIRHSQIEEMPRPGHRYRCHICRLELVIDERTNKLTVTPADDHQHGTPSPKPR